MAYWDKYFDRRLLREALIEEDPNEELGIIITIPAHREENTKQTLRSIINCTAPCCTVEVYVLINHSENASDELLSLHSNHFKHLKSFVENYNLPSFLKVFILKDFALPKKKAGVGVARKILMDEAAQRFIQIRKDQGIIVGLDADTTVESNYLIEIDQHYKAQKELRGCSIGFKHSLQGLDNQEKKAITEYESHLRYFVAAQRWAGFPFAFQTIGSAMAVRCKWYIRYGGMNQRQAGEDFYFLQKFIESSYFDELNSTTVHPSGRVSDRVPFGTGKAVGKLVQSGEELLTYNFNSFKDLKIFLEIIPLLYLGKKVLSAHDQKNLQSILSKLPKGVQHFLADQKILLELEAIHAHVTNYESFSTRFYQWFNAFRLMKYVHFMRDNYYPNIPISKALESIEIK